MTRTSVAASPSLDITGLSLVVTGIAGLVVPPSLSRPGLSSLERMLAISALPTLIVAFVALLFALSLGPVGQRRMTAFSLFLVNVAAFLSGRYGIDGGGLGFTLVLTGPLLAIIAKRELAERAQRPLPS